MWKHRRKLTGFAMAAGLFSSVFQPAGCNVSVDAASVQAVLDFLQNWQPPSGSGGGGFWWWHHGGPPNSHEDDSGDDSE